MRLSIVILFLSILLTIHASPVTSQTPSNTQEPSTRANSQRGLQAVKISEVGTDKMAALYQRSYALVIGIDNYQDPAWPRLSNAINDAKAVAKALEARGFEVTLKIDPTSSSLKQAVDSFIFNEGHHENARLFIWFAGHGHTINGEGYLVPADAPSPDKQNWKFRVSTFEKPCRTMEFQGECI